MARATKIMVIRHAEKPDDSGVRHGVTAKGERDSESLTIRGWQRAGAYVCFFAPSAGPLQHPAIATPRHLFASKVAASSNSKRPEETIKPLSSKLGLKIDSHCTKADHDEMATRAMVCDGVVLICWEHQLIPTIARRILGDAATVPENWPDDRFDLVWVFDRDPATGAYGFEQVASGLLDGDLPTVIS